MIDKDSLRREYKKRLTTLSSVQRTALSAAIRSKLSAWSAFKSAHAIIAFYPMRGEPDSVPALQALIAAGYTVGLVRTPDFDEKRLLEVRLWDGSESSLERHKRMPLLQSGPRLPRLEQETWRMPRPEQAGGSLELLAAAAGVVLVPGLAFGRDGSRLGHGMGWYDIFLKANPSLLRVGLGFGFQVSDSLPRDEWDQNLDFLITEEGVEACRS